MNERPRLPTDAFAEFVGRLVLVCIAVAAIAGAIWALKAALG